MSSTPRTVQPVGTWTNVSKAAGSVVPLLDEEATARRTAQTSTSHRGQARLHRAAAFPCTSATCTSGVACMLKAGLVTLNAMTALFEMKCSMHA